MPRTTKSRRSAHRSRERGQAAVFLVLALGIFLIGGVGFVVDGANLWFHRQSAQTAADAACTAGAMDMLSQAAGVTPPSTNWIPATDDGSTFHCYGTSGSTQNSTFPPCSYASFNGYSGTTSQDVQVGFPTLSVTAGCPNSIPFSTNVCAADNVASTLYVQVTVTDNVPTTFMRLVGANPSTAVPAKATCGLSNVLSAVPVLVLNPNVGDTMRGSGFTFAVGFTSSGTTNPPKVLQVNSSDPAAVSSLAGTVTLTNEDGSKGNFAIAGQSSPGSDGSYTAINEAGIVSDPFASIVPPAQPGQRGSFQPRVSSSDCPPGSSTCDIYTPGYWPGGLTVQPHVRGAGNPSGVAVFEPGLYYLDGAFSAGANTCIRPSMSTGAGGVVFYFKGGQSLQISSDSGQLTRGAFDCQGDTVPTSVLACPSASAGNLPSGGISGNVLLAPCEGTYSDINSNQQVVGDPLGTSDPIGEQRGMLFFQDRDSTASPNWSSVGSFGLIGNIYFHHCGSGSGSGANCSSSAFDDTMTIGSGENSYIVGDIVVDQLAINSGANISVSLNPNPQYYVLKASLLQ